MNFIFGICDFIFGICDFIVGIYDFMLHERLITHVSRQGCTCAHTGAHKIVFMVCSSATSCMHIVFMLWAASYMHVVFVLWVE